MGENGGTIKLVCSVENDVLDGISTNIIFDLNGNSYTNAGFGSIGSGVFTIKDSIGSGTFKVNGVGADKIGVQAQNGGKIILENGTIEAYNGVSLFKDGEFVMSGGTIKAKSIGVSGNGSVEEGNSKIVLNGGTIQSESLGVFAPQIDGVTTLGKVKIDAKKCGVEVRAGQLIVDGATINVDEKAKYEFAANDNGGTASGVAIAVAQHTTKQPINVEVKSGSFTAPVPVSEANPQKNDSASIDKVNIKIAGGEFTAKNTKNIGAVYSEDKANFITGGTFSELDEKYITEEGGYDYATTNDGIEVVDLAALDEEGNELDDNHKIVSKKIDYKGETKEAITGEAEGTVAGSVEFIGDVEIDRKGYFVIEDHGTDGLITKATSSDSKLVAAFDLNMYDRDHKIVKVSDTEMKVKIALTEDQYNQLKQYNSVVAVYFDEEGNETEERIAAELVAGEDKSYYVVFTVTHFSTYGIIGVNEETTVTTPETGTMTAAGASAANAGILAAATAGVISAIVGIAAIIRRK